MRKTKRREIEEEIIRVASQVANQHYRGRHSDLGWGWMLTEIQMEKLRAAVGELQRMAK